VLNEIFIILIVWVLFWCNWVFNLCCWLYFVYFDLRSKASSWHCRDLYQCISRSVLQLKHCL